MREVFSCCCCECGSLLHLTCCCAITLLTSWCICRRPPPPPPIPFRAMMVHAHIPSDMEHGPPYRMWLPHRVSERESDEGITSQGDRHRVETQLIKVNRPKAPLLYTIQCLMSADSFLLLLQIHTHRKSPFPSCTVTRSLCEAHDWWNGRNIQRRRVKGYSLPSWVHSWRQTEQSLLLLGKWV